MAKPSHREAVFQPATPQQSRPPRPPSFLSQRPVSMFDMLQIGCSRQGTIRVSGPLRVAPCEGLSRPLLVTHWKLDASVLP
eukprot:7025225-Alexandrium_andersonii.AAC.1